MGKTAEEHLTELLNQKDEKITELELAIFNHDDEEERERLRDMWTWTHHDRLDEDDVDLPVPRLEMRWVQDDSRGYNRTCWYYLVYKHFLDDIIKVPMGHTAVNGGRPEPFWEESQQIDTPFRDGAHIASDAKHLRLPAFVIWKDKVQEIIPGGEKGFKLGPLKEIKVNG